MNWNIVFVICYVLLLANILLSVIIKTLLNDEFFPCEVKNQTYDPLSKLIDLTSFLWSNEFLILKLYYVETLKNVLTIFSVTSICLSVCPYHVYQQIWLNGLLLYFLCTYACYVEWANVKVYFSHYLELFQNSPKILLDNNLCKTCKWQFFIILSFTCFLFR